MNKIIIKEIIFFVVLIVVLALLQHGDLLTNPSDRIELMSQKENYLHPFLWASAVYFVILLFRLILVFVLKFFRKNK